jgi:hypothetical protein
MSFQYINPNKGQKALMQEFRDKFEALSEKMAMRVPSSRGHSLAHTKLEEASFWLNKAITGND